jgi:hypothetical protein
VFLNKMFPPVLRGLIGIFGMAVVLFVSLVASSMAPAVRALKSLTNESSRLKFDIFRA